MPKRRRRTPRPRLGDYGAEVIVPLIAATWRRDFAEPDEVAELADLERSLLDIAPTLDQLVQRHGIELPGPLEILREHRFRWRFGNTWRLFRSWPVREIERAAATLGTAARFLEDAGPVLLSEWGESLHALAVRTRGLRRAELATLDDEQFKVAQHRSAARVPEASETQEQLSLLALALQGDVAVSRGHLHTDLPAQLKMAIAVLRKAEETVRRRDWKQAVDRRGRRVFGRGRRREFVFEASCARDLIGWFQEKGGKPLYDYVGELLVATFPALSGWRSSKKRLRDHVRQLLAS